ncbi:hypothetical protein N7490_006588 [Penicillium lividum]|nr:hypothetical protein N7490_006588 [Penicillium lividum]
MEKIDPPPPSLTHHSLQNLEPSLKDVLQSQASTVMIASQLSTSSRVNFLDLFEDFVLEALQHSPQRLQNFRQDLSRAVMPLTNDTSSLQTLSGTTKCTGDW